VDDAALVADLDTAAHPHSPADPILHRHYWENPTPGWSRERFVAELDGLPVGFCVYLHAPWDREPERWARINGYLVPEAASKERLREVYGQAMERAAADGALIFAAQVFEDEAASISALEALGFAYDRYEKNWELDLVTRRIDLLALAEAAAERMRREGIEVLTLDDDPDPDKMGKLVEVQNATQRDIPRTQPVLDVSLEEFSQWFKSPALRTDRYWIARDGDRIVGLSFIEFPPQRGHAATGYTAVLREYRGRGIARALKMASLRQAIEIGVERVRTDNDEKNHPILHINEDLGYQRVVGWKSYIKRPA
jgi:GNAT superfamily N-acetyltransferase